jgi:hypothetical protein
MTSATPTHGSVRIGAMAAPNACRGFLEDKSEPHARPIQRDGMSATNITMPANPTHSQYVSVVPVHLG